MIFAYWTLATFTVAFGLVPFVMTLTFWRYTNNALSSTTLNNFFPRTTLIVPCKGTDLHFDENIQSFLQFDYPNYNVIFVTATNDDPAYTEIDRILHATSRRAPARLIVAGIKSGCGQKMNNMLAGVAAAAEETQVFAFMDADIRVYPGLLKNLINPLQTASVGAASGFPVFLPEANTLGAFLKSIWGIGGLLIMADKKRNIASGAVNCIKKEIFHRSGIARALTSTVSDTMAITKGVRSLGLDIVFVPSALIVSADKSSLRETIHWTNRLTIFTRVYNRPFWWTVALSYSFSTLMILLGGLTLGAVGLGGDVRLVWPASLMLGLTVLQVVHAITTFPLIVRLLSPYPAEQKRLNGLRNQICLLAPIGGFLIMINSLHSLTTNVVTWRGIRYRLVSSTKTEVLND